jgi:hypothetical protein
MSEITSLSDYDGEIQGALQTVCDRQDAAEAEIIAWVEERGGESFVDATFLRHPAEAAVYFEALVEEGWEAAEEAIGGQTSYERRVGPLVDELEDDFLLYKTERPALVRIEPGRRSRRSPLAERAAALI